MVTNLSNPKVLVFFGPVFAQFIRPNMSTTWTIAVAVILVAMSVTWFSFLALIVRTASRWIAHHSGAIDSV
ncbi:LysE family transporter [Corynebacterium macginleyi]|uniref:LysE family transporter n=1 Tax=Corynebacterium macginleyi TaxID=38290 RepID=UPI002D7EB7B5|nr:LysE family transporter [Corynebacterium macginleyi]